MEQLPQLDFAGAVVAVNLLGELVKKIPLLNGLLREWLPLVLEVAGFALGLGLGLGWFPSLFVGFSAMGLYSGAKHLKN